MQLFRLLFASKLQIGTCIWAELGLHVAAQGSFVAAQGSHLALQGLYIFGWTGVVLGCTGAVVIDLGLAT